MSANHRVEAMNPEPHSHPRIRALLVTIILLVSNATSIWAKHSPRPTIPQSSSFPIFNQTSPPIVTIENPKMDALFVGPATIKIEARAIDRDGTIKQVEFFDNGESIGTGTSQ